jgi:hypothetical protein
MIFNLIDRCSEERFYLLLSNDLITYHRMPSELNRRHVFISHHHQDDEHVTRMTGMLKRHDYDIRNSSIRAKPSNQRRLDQGMVSERTIKRLLQMKMSWATTIVVLIGKETHARPWVNWEIEQANRLGKRIVGVFTRGSSEEDIPPAFEKYGSDLVNWSSDSIIAAIDGTREGPFQDPAGNPRQAPITPTTTIC